MLTSREQATERGQAIVVLALILPALFAFSAVVVGLGNWFVHGKHLQTKADAGALAGGGAFQFPCAAGIDAIDTRIAAIARQYAGPTASTPAGYNPQVGGVPGSSVHTVLNAPTWYDNDSIPPDPGEDLDICDGTTPMRLDVKVTEDNSFPLASLIPLFPDIKRKAVVELFETDGMSGLLPIAVRAPEPESALAIFYDESDPNKTILGREYLLEKTGPTGTGWVTGSTLPSGLQGWSTEVALGNPRGWTSFVPSARTGVVIAVSYRGACDTWGGTAPATPPPGIYHEPVGRCLEDGLGQGVPSYTTVDGPNGICNQGGSVQVANCYYATDPGSAPNDEVVESGLHFIRGYSTPGAGVGAPQLHMAYLTSGACSTGYGSGYFAAFPNVCPAGLAASMDIGSCHRVVVGGNPTGGCVPQAGNTIQTRIADNVEIKYTLVYGTGNNNDICDFGPSCDVGNKSLNGTVLSFSGPLDMSSQPNRTRYAVALRIRLQRTFVQGLPDCSRQNFGGNCEFYYLGTSGPIANNEPNNSAIFNNPVQRIFRGNSITAGHIRWLNMKADRNPCGSPPFQDGSPGQEGSVLVGAPSCFVVEVGLKGGIAADATDIGYLFNDGAGTSQLGYLDCTESGPQNIVWELMNGCPPLYGPHRFDYTPLCPSANNLFTLPNPGTPWDADWRPLRCVKTRPTSQGNDLVKGLNGRFFYPNDPNPSPQPPNTCPPQNGPGYTQGRNYWRRGGTHGSLEFGYREGPPPAWQTNFSPLDARLVTIFLTTPESFTGSGQNTYPITGAIGVYIRGYGRVSGNGSITVDDPCADPPPPDLDTSGGNAGGRVVWGSFVNLAVLSAGATPSGVHCNPGASSQPCVPVLVE
jgi:hypothetical protein